MTESISNKHVVTCGIVILEFLRGLKHKTEIKTLTQTFQGLPQLEITPEIWFEAASLSRELREKGVQAGMADITIAIIAIAHKATLVHCDSDYERIAKHSDLKTISFLK